MLYLIKFSSGSSKKNYILQVWAEIKYIYYYYYKGLFNYIYEPHYYVYLIISGHIYVHEK